MLNRLICWTEEVRELELKEANRISSKQHVLLAYPVCRNDGISLLHIWRILWKRRKLLAGSVFTAALLAVGVAFSLPVIYRAETSLLPPRVNDVVKLNVLGGGDEANPEQVYTEFLKNLQSSGVRYSFFERNLPADKLQEDNLILAADYEVFKKEIDERIRVISNKKKGKNSVFRTVKLDGGDAEAITQWLNDYIQFVDSYTVQDLVRGLQSQIQEKVNSLQGRVKALRQVARKQRLGKIEQLKEAIAIATKLDISEFKGSPFVAIAQNRNTGNNVDVVSNNEAPPLYFRGYKALRLEMEQLEKRKNDDPYIFGLQEIEEELAFLNKIHITVDTIHAVRVDQYAVIPNEPIAPKCYVVIALGGFLGLLLGVVIVFIKNVNEVA